MLKKILYSILATLLILPFVVFLSLKAWLPGFIKSTLQERARASLNAELEVEQIKINWGLPLRFKILHLKLNKLKEYQVEFPNISGTLDLKEGLRSLSHISPIVAVTLDSPVVTYHLPKTAAPAKVPSGPPPKMQFSLPIASLSDVRELAPVLKDLNLTAEVSQATLKVMSDDTDFFNLQKFDFSMSLPSLDQGVDFKFTGEAKLKNEYTPFTIPFSGAALVILNESVINFSAGDFSVLGMKTKVHGLLDAARKTLNLLIDLNIAQLEQLPLPNLPELPIKKLKGSLVTKFKLMGQINDPTIDGTIQLKNGEIQFLHANDKLQIEGPILLDLDSQFVKTAKMQKLAIPSLKWNIDLTQTKVSLPELFLKPIGVVLKSQGAASFADTIRVDSLVLNLAQLDLRTSGTYNTTGDSKFKLEILPTNLVGFEKFIIPLSHYPIQGSISLKSEIDGVFSDPAKLKINIQSVNLDKISTTLQYKTPELSANGTVKLDLKGQLFVDRMNVKSGNLSLSSDLTHLAFKYKDLLQKNTGEIAQINVVASKNGSQLTLRQGQIVLPSGTIVLKGSPPVTLTTPMNLDVEIKSLDLAKLGQWVPMVAKLVPAGTLKTALNIQGRLKPENYLQSSLTLNGQIDLDLPQFSLASETPPPAPAHPPVESKPAEPFLPNLPMIRDMKLSGTVNIGQLTMTKFALSGVSSQFKVLNSNLIATAQIKNLFDGNLVLNQAIVPLLKVDPEINFEFRTQGLRVEKALKAFLPEYEKVASGSLLLAAKGHSRLPGTPRFIEDLGVDGTLTLSQAVLSTLQLGEMLKGLIEKIPGGKPEAVASRGPLQADVTAQFKVKRGEVAFAPFDATTVRKEQLTLNGKANFKMDLNFVGSLFLVDPLIGGSFYEANRDARGRLEIPLAIQGNALKPEFKYAEETISRMISKTIEYEKNKALQKAQTQVKAEVQKQVEQKKTELKDKLTEDLKKKAQGLFH